MKKIVSILIAILMLTSSTSVFSAWESDDDIISLLTELKIMQGDADGSFRPYDLVTRAEFTKIVVASSPYRNSVPVASTVSPFKDVPASEWYAPYVLTGVNNGYINGYTDATFRPDNSVTYEEALTMLLRLIGYTDSDFGASWPYGQVGIASSIGLVDGVNSSIGEGVNRRQVMTMVYNMLNADSKGTTNDFINTLDYSIVENAVLIATAREDSSVGGNKVFTSAGSYKINSSFNYDNVGKKGDIVIKNGDEVAVFIPNRQIVNKYSVYQVLTDDIVVIKNGEMASLGAEKNLTVYKKSNQSILSNMLAELSVGDVITTYSTSDGTLDYGFIETDELKGPYTVNNENWLSNTGLLSPVVMRNGVKSSVSAIKNYDVYYYSTALNTVWCYSNKITGVYESASPNKDNPTSVVVSGTEYSIESVDAFNKLSSNGYFEIGDTVTLLLGRTNDVADVMTDAVSSNMVVGYMYETGTKEFTNTDTTVSVCNYIKVAMPSGESYEYKANKDYSNYVNSVVKVTFTDGEASISVINGGSAVSGRFDWTAKTLGGANLSPDVKIIDIRTTEQYAVGSFMSVFPQRIDNANISAESVLYAGKSSSGEITELILKDFTGDLYSYAVLTKAKSNQSDVFVSGQYTLNENGAERSYMTTSSAFSVTSGQPVKVAFENGTICEMKVLTKLSTAVKSVDSVSISSNGTEYLVSDDVHVFLKGSDNSFTIMPYSQLIGSKDYNLSVYYDKLSVNGGRVRIIIAVKK